MYHPKLDELVGRDPRYPLEAYEFLYAALEHTQKRLHRVPAQPGPPTGECHVSGRELLDGIRDLALREFGLMARTVFRLWNIHRTDDFGALVFNLVEAGLMNKTDEDRPEDFQDVFDLDQALTEGFRIDVNMDAEEVP
jgi:uncharacterized repeat protein (TIGR04138 family)